MKFSLKALFCLVTTVALLFAVSVYSYQLGMEAGEKSGAERLMRGLFGEGEGFYETGKINR
jgi:hypothetical protein